MAKFNVEGYRKEAKEAGIDDKEIEQVIKEETAGEHPEQPKIDNPAEPYSYIKPAAITLATGLGLKMAKNEYEKYQSIKNEGRPQRQSEKIAEKIEPLLDINQQRQTGRIEPTLLPEAPVAPTSPPVASAPVAPPASTAPVTLPNAQAPTPVATTSTPQEMANFATGAVAPPAQPAPVTPAQQVLKAETNPQPSVNPTSPIATTEPNQIVSGEGTSPLHNPAGQGLTQVEATSASATPNAAFPAETNTTKESGNLTNSAENPTQGGVEQVKKEVKGSVKPRAPRGSKIAELEASGLTKPELSMKKYLTSFYGGGEHGEDAYKKVTEILGKTPAYPVDEKGKMTGGGLTKDENDLIKIFRKENIEGPKINLTKSMKDQLSEIKKVGGSKTVKGAALLSALVALPEFVNAKNAYETSQAKQNLGESLLPIGATPTPVESGKLTSKQLEQYKEYGKLGSPYRQAFLQQTGGK
jgi:hypothetical protein